MVIPIDRLVRSRRKTIAIIVERDASLTVRAPQRMSEARINAFVESHRAWITRNQAKVLAAGPISPKRYAEGEKFFFLGQAYPLNILPRQRSALDFDGKSFRLSKSALPKAQEAFVRLFQQGNIPTEMPEFTLAAGQTVSDVLLAAGLVSSKSDGRRMIDQKGVKLDGEVLEKADAVFPHPGVLQVGKRRFVRCI